MILEKWWKQQSHRWQHYAGTVPWMGLINGKVSISQVPLVEYRKVLTMFAPQNHTQFAGAWTVISEFIFLACDFIVLNHLLRYARDRCGLRFRCSLSVGSIVRGFSQFQHSAPDLARCSRYPFRDNQDCKRLFALCLGVNHMMRMVCENMIHLVQGI